MTLGNEPLAAFGPAREGDTDALIAIDRLSPTPWTRQAFEAELRGEARTTFVLRLSGQVVAFVVTRTQSAEMDIVNLAVDPEHRRRGLGHLLARSVVERAAREGVQTVFLEVRESNQPARKLYEDLGFKETQRRRGFYAAPVEDAILMSLQIEPSAWLKGSRNAC